MSNQVEDGFKFLWPFQNVRTLWSEKQSNEKHSETVFNKCQPVRHNQMNKHWPGYSSGIWLCGCSLFYRRELWISKSEGAKGDGPKICRFCTHADAIPAVHILLIYSDRVNIFLRKKSSLYCALVGRECKWFIKSIIGCIWGMYSIQKSVRPLYPLDSS